jgi:predicted transcriptional regulator
MPHTVWITAAYDPAATYTPPEPPPPQHADVLVCLFAGMTRIAAIAKQLQRSETYVKNLLEDLQAFGLVTQQRMPGKGLRVEFFPKACQLGETK